MKLVTVHLLLLILHKRSHKTKTKKFPPPPPTPTPKQKSGRRVSDFEEAEVVGLGVPGDHGEVGDLDEDLVALAEEEDGPQVAGVLPERLVGPPALGDGVLHQLLLPAVGVDDVVAVQVV